MDFDLSIGWTMPPRTTGVDDGSHEIVGTKVRLQLEKKGEQELENWLRYLLSKMLISNSMVQT